MAAPTVLIVGGSSGMGKAAAKACIRAAMPVTIAGRSLDKLQAAKVEILADNAGCGRVEIEQLDASDENSTNAFFESRPDGAFSNLVVTLGPSSDVSSILGLDGLQGLRKQFDVKFFAQLAVVSLGASKVR